MYQHHWKNRLLQTLRPLQQQANQVQSWLKLQNLTLTSGKLTGSDTSIRMLTLGSSNLLLQAFFEAASTRSRVIGQVKPLHAAKVFKEYRQNADLILLPCTPFSPPADETSLLLPDYLDATILFDESEEQWRKNLRELNKRGLKQAAKRQYQFRAGSTVQDYELFYHRMLQPYVQQRHGYHAYVESCDAFCADTHGAVLEFVELDGRPVAGFHLKLSARHPLAYFNKIGLSAEASADKHLMRELNCLIYQRMVQLAREAGHHGVHLGQTPPILDNGITWYKAGWGAVFSPNLSLQRYRLHFCSERAPLIQQHAHPLVTLQHGRLCAQLLCNAENREDLQAQARGWQFKGLDALHFSEPGAAGKS